LTFLVGVIASLWSGWLSAAEGPIPKPGIRWRTHSTNSVPTWVEVTDLPLELLRQIARLRQSLPEWQRLFPVYAEPGDLIADMELPPMAGQYQIVDGTLRFEPPFPWEAGVRYRAVFRPASLPSLPGGPRTDLATLSETYRRPARARVPTTVVSQIYPTPAILPENLLKFYLHFSAPMSRGHIYDYIRLENAAGQPVELPFLEINEELWNPAMTRLTLFLDPGRIKRGVRPLEEVGPSLVTGRSYQLLIDPAWPDAEGNHLRAGFTKQFRVEAPDREPPNPDHWNLTAPRIGTRDPVVVQFNEPLDQAILQRVVRVADPAGSLVPGPILRG
jgi:hypothetical protein